MALKVKSHLHLVEALLSSKFPIISSNHSCFTSIYYSFSYLAILICFIEK